MPGHEVVAGEAWDRPDRDLASEVADNRLGLNVDLRHRGLDGELRSKPAPGAARDQTLRHPARDRRTGAALSEDVGVVDGHVNSLGHHPSIVHTGWRHGHQCRSQLGFAVSPEGDVAASRLRSGVEADLFDPGYAEKVVPFDRHRLVIQSHNIANSADPVKNIPTNSAGHLISPEEGQPGRQRFASALGFHWPDWRGRPASGSSFESSPWGGEPACPALPTR